MNGHESTGLLPSLVGSDKQVAWATDIRAKVLGTVIKNRERLLSAKNLAGLPEPKQQYLKEVYDEISRTDSAKFYIDNHQYGGGARGMVAGLLDQRARRELDGTDADQLSFGRYFPVYKSINGRTVTLSWHSADENMEVRFLPESEFREGRWGKARTYQNVRDAVAAARRYLAGTMSIEEV